MLHLTNGDFAAELIRRAGVPGEVIPWRDVLHEGPVPEGQGAAELRATRARFLASQGWGDPDENLRGLERRDEALDAAGEHDEVVLWFEHDLYDQLQLIEILDRLARLPTAEARVSLICIGEHPAVDRFIGLGQLEPHHLAELFDGRARVSAAQRELARRAWAAFRAPEPTVVEALLAADTSALPFLRAALLRHLEQLPAERGGLSRTGRQIVEVVAAGVRQPGRVFRAVQDLEEAPFMSDLAFLSHLRELGEGPRPLLRSRGGGTPPGEAELELTEDGQRVRARAADWVRLRGGIDRWYGGVHLSGPEPRWRWDDERGRLVGS